MASEARGDGRYVRALSGASKSRGGGGVGVKAMPDAGAGKAKWSVSQSSPSPFLSVGTLTNSGTAPLLRAMSSGSVDVPANPAPSTSSTRTSDPVLAMDPLRLIVLARLACCTDGNDPFEVLFLSVPGDAVASRTFGGGVAPPDKSVCKALNVGTVDSLSSSSSLCILLRS